MNHMTPFESVLVTTCVIGAILCTAILIAFRIRRELELIHEQWLRIGPLGRVMSILGVSIVVLYGGTKPPASTNEPPNTTGGDTTNEPPIYIEGDLVSTNEPPDSASGDGTSARRAGGGDRPAASQFELGRQRRMERLAAQILP